MSELNIPNRTIYCSDNINILPNINTESIDLIYLDPPFNKKKVFTAPIGSASEGASFSDIFREKDIKEEWIKSIKEDNAELHTFLECVKNIEGRTSYNFCYLTYMAIRLIELKRILKDTGSLYLHCDATMSHYLKVLLDIIFDEKNFRNEITWIYRKWNVAQKQFPNNHDYILMYSKTQNNYFNTTYIPKSNKSSGKGKQILSVIDEETGKRKSVYLEKKSKGTPMPDWFDIAIINPMAKERTGYPTQKPLKLLERIIKASCPEGGIVLDPFCGCATTCVASEKLGRQWIGIDVSHKAYELVKKRLDKEITANLFDWNKTITYSVSPPKRTDIGEDTIEKKWVYVVSNPNYPKDYKVGIAKDWKSRLNSYQTSDPDRSYKMEYKILTPHFRSLEKHIHKKFENNHEWVRADLKNIIKEIENYKN